MILFLVLLFVAASQGQIFLVQTTYYSSSTCIPGTDVGYILTKTSPGPCVASGCTNGANGFTTVSCPTEFPSPNKITTTTYDNTGGYCLSLEILGLSFFQSQISFKDNTCIPDATFAIIANYYGLPNYVRDQFPGRQFQCYNDIYSLAYQNWQVMDNSTGTCVGVLVQGQTLFQRSAGTNVPSMYKCADGIMSTGCGIPLKCFHESTIISYKGKELSLKALQNQKEPECEIPHVLESQGVVIEALCEGKERKVLKVTSGHLLYTQRGLQKAADILTNDKVFADMEERKECSVISNKIDHNKSKYFGLNCHNSAVLASGIKSSTFEKIHSVPSFWMSVVGRILGIKRATFIGDYIATIVDGMNLV